MDVSHFWGIKSLTLRPFNQINQNSRSVMTLPEMSKETCSAVLRELSRGELVLFCAFLGNVYEWRFAALAKKLIIN
jgi:hypothetical protein